MITKRQIIEQSYDELALAGYVFDLTPEELLSAARRLNGIVAAWINQGVTVPFAFDPEPTEDALDGDSGLPLTAYDAAYMALAVRTAASKGKALSPVTKGAARAAFDALLSDSVKRGLIPQSYRSGTPLGAGTRTFDRSEQYATVPDPAPLGIAEDGGLAILGG